MRQATENIATKEQKEEIAAAAAAIANALTESYSNVEAGVTEANDDNDDNKMQFDVQNIIRYCSEIATLIGVLSYVIFQQGDEIRNQGLAAFMKQLVRHNFHSITGVYRYEKRYYNQSFYAIFVGKCPSKGNISIIKFVTVGMHTIQNFRRHRHRGSHFGVCCTG